MTSLNSRADIYDPKTLAVMDQAFAAIWHMLRPDDPFRDFARDAVRIAIGKKLVNLWRSDRSCSAAKSHRGKPAVPRH